MKPSPTLTRIATPILLAASLATALDAPSFPATGDLSIVFPRNETYDVVAPFPVIFGFNNSPVLLSFASSLYWTLDCRDGTLFGLGRLEGDNDRAPPSENPYFYVNGSSGCALCDKDGNDDPFPYFRHGDDECKLEWEFSLSPTCSLEADGTRIIKSGYGKKSGTVNFTLKPGAANPYDAILNYKGCPVAGAAIEVASKINSCPELGKDAEPKPCDLDVKAVASSLAGAIAKPTATFGSTATAGGSSASVSVTATGSGSGGAAKTSSGAPSASATGSGDGSGASNGGGASGTGQGEKDSVASIMGVGGGFSALILAFLFGGLIPLFL